MVLGKLILVVLSSILHAMAMPNEFFHYGSMLIGFIALIPLFYVIYTSSDQKETILFSGLFGLLSSSLVYFWLIFFKDFSVWTISGVATAHTLYFIVLGSFIALVRKKGIMRPFLTAVIWTGYEYLKSIGYLGFPWNLMAQSAGIAPFVQIADITGQWGVSFLIVLVNAMILETLLKYKKELFPSWIFTVILFAGSIIYGIYIDNMEIPSDKSLTILMVQQDADSWVSGKEIESIKKGQDLTRLEIAKNKTKPDMIVWSENAFRYPYIENSSRYKKEPMGDPFNSFLREMDTPILVGSPYILNIKAMDVLNAVLLISPGGEILQYYGKSHPVPFAENIPFWDIDIVSSFFKNVVGLKNRGWTIGKSNIIFRTPLADGDWVSFGVPICFEDSFPYISRAFIKHGADLLINLSNDSWSKTVTGETQHLAAARLRAIENRRTLIRSTNAGVSTIIDPWGRMNYTMPLFQAYTLTAKVPIYKKDTYTVYTMLGNWFPILLILCSGLYFLYDIYIRKGTLLLNKKR